MSKCPIKITEAKRFMKRYQELCGDTPTTGTKKALTPIDMMRLEAARGLTKVGSLPSVHSYNAAVESGKTLCGIRIIPIGGFGIE